MEALRRTINAALGLLAVTAGGVGAAWLIHTTPPPPVQGLFALTPDVAIVSVEPQTTQSPVVGYGTVRPKEQINIVPQVSGELVFAHDDLAQGKVIPVGELIFRIDPTIYESRVRQSEAEIRGLEAALQRHDQEMVNLDERIANVEQMLRIDEQDYLTSKRLYEVDNVGTQREVDVVHQKYLRQKDVLVELNNRRDMVPHLKLETQAQLDAARSRLNQAEHHLEATKIICPFDARVESVGAHASQVVTAHLSIATLTNMEAFEISVGIDPREMRWLDEAVRPAALEQDDVGPGPAVRVSWSLPDQEFSWRGYVTRFERVDEATRTARMVVEVRDVDMVARLDRGSGDVRPTLSIGMHCRADLPARVLEDALVVPRHAIYDQRWVYVFEPDPSSPGGTAGTLGRRAVPMLRALGEHVLVDYVGREGTDICDLRAGESLVVSPLAKPVVGMKVMLREERLATAAAEWPLLPPTPERRVFAAVRPERSMRTSDGDLDLLALISTYHASQ